jgi:aryl-alcohol dehydrogenase-like predicted oxidoreductase
MGLEPEVDDWHGTALRFAAFTPGVSTAIVGSSKPEHVRQSVDAVRRGPLPDAERTRWLEGFAPHAAEWPGEA